jgi:hypothetical protein
MHAMADLHVLQLLIQFWQTFPEGKVELGHVVTQYPSKKYPVEHETGTLHVDPILTAPG